MQNIIPYCWLIRLIRKVLCELNIHVRGISTAHFIHPDTINSLPRNCVFCNKLLTLKKVE